MDRELRRHKEQDHCPDEEAGEQRDGELAFHERRLHLQRKRQQMVLVGMANTPVSPAPQETASASRNSVLRDSHRILRFGP